MNIDTGEIDRMATLYAAMMEKLTAGMQQLPRHLSPFAEAHMESHPGEPVYLSKDSRLANYASKQRAKRAANPGAFGKAKNRP